ncbi:arginine biosynthesis bifunctional protein ArgJ, chloroplastic isoform X2 [Selaginella moellendorffii]|nr:arginine biosynthesis bifunctional protein ArgJ, chloroplastic isoform X2 [Selaginella moellendorffii]|eukprot:XP_002978127.2 arginine biosynthesis bifunctional protein ArgJ, chloroplastic isoform X2 [Selaginella moellendorffii]
MAGGAMLTMGAKASSLHNEVVTSGETIALPAAHIRLPRGPWTQIPGGVAGPCGFRAAGLYGGLRALGTKPDLALVVSDVDAVCAGTFTTNVVAAAPVLYCKRILAASTKARAVLINAGQANAATGDAGYQDALDCATAVAKLLGTQPERVLLQSTGVIGKRIKKDALLASLPRLVGALSYTADSGDAAATAITTTDLVTKSVAIETEVGGTTVKIGGMAKGSGMIHPNMATMLSVVTCDAHVSSDVWQDLVKTAVGRSFNQITVDGDTSTNDTVLALASGASRGRLLDNMQDRDAQQLQAALDAVFQGLAMSIASDGEGATCLVEVEVTGAHSDDAAAVVARSVARSSLVKAAVYGRDPNWGRVACAAGYSGVDFDPQELEIRLGSFVLMQKGQPLEFDRAAAKDYLRAAGEVHGVVAITISIGGGTGRSTAWGCDLSYDYVKINADYTT